MTNLDLDDDERFWIDEDDDADYMQCPTCNGVGTINPLNKAAIFCVGHTDCPDCDGTGKMP